LHILLTVLRPNEVFRCVKIRDFSYSLVDMTGLLSSGVVSFRGVCVCIHE